MEQGSVGLVFAFSGRRRAGLQPVQEIRGALGMGCGAENEPLVAFENRQPVPDIGGMVVAGLRGQVDIRREESAAELGHQLLAGVAFVTPPLAPEVSVKPGRMPGPVGELMGEGRIIALGITEARKGRQLYAIGCGAVPGAVSAVSNRSAAVEEEALRRLDASDRGRGGRIALRQPVDLFDIEHGIALEEGDLAGLFLLHGSGIARPRLFVHTLLARLPDPAGIDDESAGSPFRT